MKNTGLLVVAVFLLGMGARADYMFIAHDSAAKTMFVNPAWSPDARSIAYVAVSDAEALDAQTLINNRKSIRIASFSDGKWHHRVLLEDAHSPVWSPDGRRLAFARNGIMVMDVRTGRLTRLTRDRQPSAGGHDEAWQRSDSPISFSPDGRYIAFGRSLWEMSEIRIYDMRLKHDLGINVGNRFAWAPDSRRVLASFEWYGDQAVPSRLAMWDLDSRKWRTVLNGYRVDDIICPKGQDHAWVLLQGRLPEGPETDLNPPNGAGVYRLDVERRSLSKLSGISHWILPSPTYKRFAFAGNPAGAERARDLYVGEIAKWQYRRIANDFPGPGSWTDRAMFVGWSPTGNSLAHVTNKGDIHIVQLRANP